MEHAKEKLLGIFAIIIITVSGMHFYRMEKIAILELRLMKVENKYMKILKKFSAEASYKDYLRETKRLVWIEKVNAEMMKRRRHKMEIY